MINVQSTIDTWEAYCEHGREIYDTIQKAQWDLGVMIANLPKVYRGHSVEEFAREIGVSKSYAYDLAKVARLFKLSTQVDYSQDYPPEVISWSHFRAAEPVKELDTALGILDLAIAGAKYPEYVKDENGAPVERLSGSPWTADEVSFVVMALRGGKIADMPVFDAQVSGVDLHNGKWFVGTIDTKKQYHVKVFEM